MEKEEEAEEEEEEAARDANLQTKTPHLDAGKKSTYCSSSYGNVYPRL